MIRRHFKLILVAIFLAIGLLCAGYYLGIFQEFFDQTPIEQELLVNIPNMDTTKYNRFQFNLKIDAGNTEGDIEEFTESGPIEFYKNVSHMYNQDIYLDKSDYKAKKESWTNFDTNEQYKNLGDGWVLSTIKTDKAIDRLADVINNRDTDRILTKTDSAYTLSWRFDTDLNYLFGELMSHYTDDLNLSGYGRATAVFDLKTYEFQYFTFIISANNSKQDGAMLDSTFYWEVINDDSIGLSIPSDIANEAYKNTTGITTNVGYDSIVNPIAEDLMNTYGGEAEIVHDKSSSSLFWTMKENDKSATINYIKTDDPKSYYEESHTFLSSFYESPAEETDNGAYFYDAKSGELIYIAKGDKWYAETTITGESNTSQGELRKSLITYKSRLGI